MAETIKVGIADLNVCTPPNLITTIGLGSCVGIAIRDKTTKVGGLVHVMLPSSQEVKSNSNVAKFADTGIPELVSRLEKMGGSRARMVAKIAGGAKALVLDVTCGFGAFMKEESRARELSAAMIRIGEGAGIKTRAVVTDMDQPLGWAVGNAVEVKEAIAVLKGEQQGDLLELCLTLGGCMLAEAGYEPSIEAARARMLRTIADGSALKKLADMVQAQGGDPAAVYDPSILPDAKVKIPAPAEKGGYVKRIHAERVGLVSMHLGGGRATKESSIDLSVGVVLNKKVGDKVEPGESLGTIHASNMEKAEQAAALLRDCFEFSDEPVERPAFIKDIIR